MTRYGKVTSIALNHDGSTKITIDMDDGYIVLKVTDWPPQPRLGERILVVLTSID
jgi:hypothetical protein